MLEKVIEACQYLLHNYPEAQPYKQYLGSRINEKSQYEFKFGYFPSLDNISVLIDLIGEEILHKLELVYSSNIEDALFPRKKYHHYFFEKHPLILPYYNSYHKPVALVGRTLLEEKERAKISISKYKNMKGTTDFQKSKLLFGLNIGKQAILDAGTVYVVEGQFDLIKAKEIGLHNIVSLGTSNMNFYQFSVISRYCNNIFLLMDNDDAGQKGRERIMKKFGYLSNIHNFYIPNPYKDIDEYITKEKIVKHTDLVFNIEN